MFKGSVRVAKAPAAPPYSVDAAHTFTSSHFRVDLYQLTGLLSRHGLFFRDVGDKLNVKDCPFCHPTKGKIDNQYKLFIWKESGSFYCHRCDTKGSYFDLKQRLSPVEIQNQSSSASNHAVYEAPSIPLSSMLSDAVPTPKLLPNQGIVSTYPTHLANSAELQALLTGTDRSLGQRGLSADVVRLYRVGATKASFQDDDGEWQEHQCITFPWTRLEPHPSTVSPAKKKRAIKAKAPAPPTDSATAAVAAGSADSPTAADTANPVPPGEALPTLVVDRVKMRSVLNKRCQRIEPSGGVWGLFGWHTVPENAEAIVVTEGEYDAMAVYQMTGLPSVSLPNGARHLPVELLPRLEKFKRIYLWMDDDVPGQEGAEKFARKLGVDRCFVVQSRVLGNPQVLQQLAASARAMESQKPLAAAQPPSTAAAEEDAVELSPPKDANEALMNAHDSGDLETHFAAVRGLILTAQPLKHKQIASFDELRSEIFRQFSDPTAIRGLQNRSLPTLNKILKGFRRGELTILTGSTGIGKTTLLSQLSIDYAEQGANTLWGSFEIKNVHLAKKMLLQFANTNLEKNINLFNMWADRFSKLPIHFLRFFGSTDVDQVLDAMEYAVYVHDVEHVVLDNLQFMLSGQGRSGLDKFDLQDRAIETFRRFATEKNVHITLVIHPRKESDDRLGVHSVFGSAKATQEADNVIIIQNGVPGICKFLEVKKNRFDGDIGVIPFRYERESNRIVELPEQEIIQLQTDGELPANLTSLQSRFGRSSSPRKAGSEPNTSSGKLSGAASAPNKPPSSTAAAKPSAKPADQPVVNGLASQPASSVSPSLAEFSAAPALAHDLLG